jgi:SAM-dependent methyltransferase
MDIRAFYEAFPYPPRDIEAAAAAPAPPSDFAAINHHVFAGRWSRERALRVLSAGCGTGLASTALASQLAANGVPFTMLCIDVSEGSLDIARGRAEAAGLAEWIDFRRAPIESLEQDAEESFDYIDFTGVLNHVEDHPRVLSALGRVLAQPGGIGVMAYGALGRTGIYPVQDALRQLGLTAMDSVPEARRLLARLPETNWLRRNPLLADFTTISDAEFADRFLNPRDRAFTVRELCGLCGDAGLSPTAFLPPILYDAKAILGEAGLRDRAEALSREEQWHLAEQLQGSLHKHNFLAVKLGDGDPAKIDFGDPNYRAVIRGAAGRALAAGFADKADARVSIAFEHDGQTKTMALRLSGLEIEVLEKLCESASFGEIREALAGEDRAALDAAIERVCGALNAIGALYLEVAPPPR